MSRHSAGNIERASDVADTPLAQIVAQPYTLALDMLARTQSESLRFFARRTAKNLELMRRLAACATCADAAAAGASFAAETAADCAQESAKLFAVAAGNFESAAASVI
jgi:hypothetical protein